VKLLERECRENPEKSSRKDPKPDGKREIEHHEERVARG
jgi:hypothetical protein